MANVFIQDSTMSAIGDAIRAKTGGTNKILPANMATEIAAIETGSDIQLIEGMEIAAIFPRSSFGILKFLKAPLINAHSLRWV